MQEKSNNVFLAPVYNAQSVGHNGLDFTEYYLIPKEYDVPHTLDETFLVRLTPRIL